MSNEQSPKDTRYYQEPKRFTNKIIQSGNQYEEVGEVNLAAFELNQYDSLTRKPALYLDSNFMTPYTKSVQKDAFSSSSTASEEARSCIYGRRCLTIVLVVMMIISSTSLAISLLIIKGVIVTQPCNHEGQLTK